MPLRTESLVVSPPATVLADGEALVRSYLATLSSPRSVSTMRESFVRVAAVLDARHYSEIPWAKLDLDAILLIKKRLEARYPPATTNLTLAAVRGLLREAADRDLIPEDFHQKARRKLKSVAGSRISKGRQLSDDEIGNLLVAAQMFDEPKGTMLRTILLLGIGLGLRREEICTLPLTCAARPGEIRVVGKGNKERVCPLDAATEEVLKRWLAVRTGISWPHRMLFASPKHGNPLSKQTLWWLLRELAAAAGLEESFSPHDLRRTFASRALDQLELREVQVLMGHARSETTARYDKRSLESLAEKRRKVTIYREEETK